MAEPARAEAASEFVVARAVLLERRAAIGACVPLVPVSWSMKSSMTASMFCPGSGRWSGRANRTR